MIPTTEPHLPSALVCDHFELEIPSRPEWIVSTIEYLEQRAILAGACHMSRLPKLGMALHEALTNAVVHGNLEVSSDLKERSDDAFAEALAERAADPAYSNRLVTIEVRADAHGCTWTLTDEGPGFDVEKVARIHDEGPDGQLLTTGRGILLMKALLDEVRFEAGGRRVSLSLKAASSAEKRRHQRVKLQETVRVAPVRPDGSVDWAAAHDAVASNVSASGIGLLQTRLASSGRVLIGMDWGGQLVYLPAEVRNCRTAGGIVEIGCRFQPGGMEASAGMSAAVSQAIDDLLEQIESRQLPLDERRVHRRVPYTSRIGIAGGPGTEPTFGFARDLSRSGISFLTTGPVAIGSRTLTLPQKDGSSVKVRAEVLRCVPLVSGVFDVGARFVDLAAAEDVQRTVVQAGKLP
jgi:anti-sigma regulatory factor (Ser/Thr protein kinase)